MVARAEPDPEILGAFRQKHLDIPGGERRMIEQMNGGIGQNEFPVRNQRGRERQLSSVTGDNRAPVIRIEQNAAQVRIGGNIP